MGSPDKSRSIQLDVLRGVAILLVLGRHVVILPDGNWLLSGFAHLLWRFGWTGVDLFFVLSGFLVGGLLFNELKTNSSLSSGRFIIRRGFKIWPAYFAFLIYLYFFYRINYSALTNWSIFELLRPNLLHIQNYATTVRGHTWSLSVEEHFYLVLPLVLYLATMKRRDPLAPIPAVPVIAFILIIFCTEMRWFVLRMRPPAAPAVLIPTHLRIDGLFFGVLLAYLTRFNKRFVEIVIRRKIFLFFAGLALISPMMFLSLEYSRAVATLGFTMLYLGYGCILLAVKYANMSSGFSGWFFKSYIARAVAFVGYFSYSIYLWHVDLGQKPIAHLVPYIKINGLPTSILWFYPTALYYLTAIVAGVVMGIIIERPFLALRDRLFPSKTKAI